MNLKKKKVKLIRRFRAFLSPNSWLLKRSNWLSFLYCRALRSCPERWWNLHPCSYSKPIWTRPLAPDLLGPALSQGSDQMVSRHPFQPKLLHDSQQLRISLYPERRTESPLYTTAFAVLLTTRGQFWITCFVNWPIAVSCSPLSPRAAIERCALYTLPAMQWSEELSALLSA